jgi:hypothetical protein
MILLDWIAIFVYIVWIEWHIAKSGLETVAINVASDSLSEYQLRHLLLKIWRLYDRLQGRK